MNKKNLNEIINEILTFVGESSKTILKKLLTDYEDLISEKKFRNDLMKTIGCLYEFTNDRDKIVDLLGKHFYLGKEEAYHIMAEYDIKASTRKEKGAITK